MQCFTSEPVVWISLAQEATHLWDTTAFCQEQRTLASAMCLFSFLCAMPWGEISDCAVYVLPVTLYCPENEIQSLLYFTFKTTAENSFHFLRFYGFSLMDDDNERTLWLSGE